MLKMLDGISAQIESLKEALNTVEENGPAKCLHSRAVTHQTYSGTYAFCPDCNADLSPSVGVSG